VSNLRRSGYRSTVDGQEDVACAPSYTTS
jgi:hypothetical protein